MNDSISSERPAGRQPFYMTWPFSDNLYAEEEDERDMELLMGLCPRQARRIWPEVEDWCDRMEYDGSMMYDECPDRGMVHQQALRIQERILKDEEAADGFDRQKDPEAKESARSLQDLIETLLFQEMHRRRRRRRRFRRHFIY